MNKIKCIIVDDEPMARALIAGYVEKTPFLQLVGQCSNALALAEQLKEKQSDLILLDIEMPELNGLEFLQAYPQPPKVICITAHREYAVQAFDVQVQDYLLKPVGYERFLKAVLRVQSQLTEEEKPSDIFVSIDREMRKIPLSDLTYIEAMGDYLKFYLTTSSKPLITKLTLSIAKEKVGTAFLQIHRSFLVNKSQITAYTADKLKVNEKWLTIGRSYKEEVKYFFEK